MGISNDVSMFYGAKPGIFEKATVLRENMTKAEIVLWEKLKDRKLFDFKFRRQHPIDIFIADFYCHPLRLVIEIDGDYHFNKDQNEYDIGRTAEIEDWGLKVIRFTNHQVFNELEIVVNEIQTEIKNRIGELGI